MRSHLKWLLPILLFFLPGPPVRGAGEPPPVRIGLRQHAAEVTFAAPEGGTVSPLTANAEGLALLAAETWKALPSETGVKLFRADGSAGGDYAAGLVITPAADGVTRVNGVVGHWDKIADRDYRGRLEIRKDDAGTLTVINELDLETYLRGVVPSEMPFIYPLAALQAQAVAARGQGLQKATRHQAEGFGLCATAHCQVYGGATSERPSTDEALRSTRGEVLTYQGQLADTLYSSTCGGHTANNEEYWPGATPVPYLRGVPDFAEEDAVPYTFPLSEPQAKQYLKYAPRVHCAQPQLARSDKLRWWSVVPRAEMEQKIEAAVGDVGELLNLQVAARGPSGMVTRLTVIGTKRLLPITGGANTRRALGLDSPSFAVEPILDKDGLAVAFIVWGAGWGHQVGMCQVGAAGLAQKSWDYRRILPKYYPGTTVERRY